MNGRLGKLKTPRIRLALVQLIGFCVVFGAGLCHVLHDCCRRRQARHSCLAGRNHRSADSPRAAIFRAHYSALPVENIRFEPSVLDHQNFLT